MSQKRLFHKNCQNSDDDIEELLTICIYNGSSLTDITEEMDVTWIRLRLLFFFFSSSSHLKVLIIIVVM